MSMEEINELIEQLSLEEKASLCSGENIWQTKAIPRLGIPSIFLSDGPHGLRKVNPAGFFDSLQATCFPTASAMGATWNINLIERVGEALGKECQANDVQLLLGPGINMKRSPLGGRNFEYYSEDPFLTGELAAAFINGVQSQGIGTSLKHFTANNQEYKRMSVSSAVDERTLREIYLMAFEIAIKKAQPWTVMCAYNPVNGVLASENKYLLYDILKQEWGFTGIVVSDWGAVHDRTLGIEAGLHLEMPGNGGINDKVIVQAVKEGRLKEERLDEVVEDLLRVIFMGAQNRKKDIQYEVNQHHELAKQVSAESITLLKNEDHILPIKKSRKIAIIGEFAKQPRIQGGGSSQVNPTRIDNVYNHLSDILDEATELLYAPGYSIANYASFTPQEEKEQIALKEEALSLAKGADTVLLFVGLPDSYESESADRKHIDLPTDQNKLIESVLAVQKNTVIILTNGTSVAMPWHTKARAIVEGWLGGQAGGSAMAEVLCGKINPSGKLAETFPIRLEDNPSFLNFPGENNKVFYGEGVFVGYRYYDAKKIAPLFPFGHGLSYTTFKYHNLSMDQVDIKDTDTLKLTVDITNTGDIMGKETVQLYLKAINSSVLRPEKELKGFQKIQLLPEETKTINFELSFRTFAFFDTTISDWKVDTGTYEIFLGASSQDIRLQTAITVTSTRKIVNSIDKYSTLKELIAHPNGHQKGTEIKTRLLQFITQNTAGVSQEKLQSTLEFMTAFILDLPLYKLPAFTQGVYSVETVQEIIEAVNGD